MSLLTESRSGPGDQIPRHKDGLFVYQPESMEVRLQKLEDQAKEGDAEKMARVYEIILVVNDVPQSSTFWKTYDALIGRGAA